MNAPPEAREAREERACNYCRTRKIKCDRSKPSCQACTTHRRHCVYSREHAKPRPSSAALQALEAERKRMEQALIRVKNADAETREALLKDVLVQDGTLHIPESLSPTSSHLGPDHGQVRRDPSDAGEQRSPRPHPARIHSDTGEPVSADRVLDISPFVSADDQGRIGIFGPTSGLHNRAEASQMHGSPPQEVRNQLIVNALVQRQKEYELRTRTDFDGTPTELAMHLLNLHWNRQHNTFLIIYRPAFTRDLMHGGPYYSRFLLNAIFASGAKFSDRPELRDDPALPKTAGNRFLRRCKELLYVDSLLEESTLPTVIGLLLLGSSYVARGEMSKSWIHTGLSIRMAFDLGLHLDIQKPELNAEDMEIRRRAFWAAFITDKLQCLYFGRSVAIQLQDYHVATELLDTSEELESWSPYIDPQFPTQHVPTAPIPTFTISAFQQFCLLSKIIARIIKCFYCVGADLSDAQLRLQELGSALDSWYKNLPSCLVFQPWSSDVSVALKPVTPNIMNLHSTYHLLVVLLHRPFVSDGHLRSKSPPAQSWRTCSTAAANITHLIGKWRESYTLVGAPYLIGYSAYVACTIHVRDAALQPGGRSHSMLLSTLEMLHDLCSLNPGLSRSERLIRNLMRVNNVGEALIQTPMASADTNSLFDLDMGAIVRMFPDPVNDSLADQPMQNFDGDQTNAATRNYFRTVNFGDMDDGMGWNDPLTGTFASYPY